MSVLSGPLLSGDPLLSGHLPKSRKSWSSPLLNGRFEKKYHFSATGRILSDVKWTLTFFFWPKKR